MATTSDLSTKNALDDIACVWEWFGYDPVSLKQRNIEEIRRKTSLQICFHDKVLIFHTSSAGVMVGSISFNIFNCFSGSFPI